MKLKVTEEFYRKRSYTHRYDHLVTTEWELIAVSNPFDVRDYYTIKYQDIIEQVTRDEFKVIQEGNHAFE